MNATVGLRLLASLLASDSTRPLTFDEFSRRVAANHPVARQARLLESMAAAGEQTARGAFDPVVGASWDAKRYGGTAYYEYVEAGLTIPTTLGFDVKLGFERASGRFAASDRGTPSGGLVSAGLSLPLGQRLLTDERRTALAQARALRSYAAGERASTVNKLMYRASAAYAAWFEGHQRVALGTEAVALAEFRLGAVRRRVVQGDAAAIDTLEASLEVQRRRVQLAEAYLASRNARIEVEGLWWSERGEPEALPSGASPVLDGLWLEPATADRLMAWLAQAEVTHPELEKAAAKLREGEAGERLAFQRRLLPDVQVTWATLAQRAEALSMANDPLDDGGDRKLGGSVKVPLLYRKERGQLAAARGMVEQRTLDRAMVRRSIGVAIRTSANTLAMLDETLALQETTVSQAQQLLSGEQRRFDAGESTLFLVNARERAVIEERLKQILLQAKRVATAAELAVAVGQPQLNP